MPGDAQKDYSTPVVLVHGYLATKDLMLTLQGKLQKAGFSTHTVDLPFLNLGDIRLIAQKLHLELAKIQLKTGAEKCDLIGVSSGGLIGWYYIKHIGGAKAVRRFVAIGTPFRGSRLGYVGVLVFGFLSPSAWQCLPHSPFLQEIINDPSLDGVEAYSLYARNDPIAPPSSCRLEGAENIDVGDLLFPVSHQHLIFSNKVFQALQDILAK